MIELAIVAALGAAVGSGATVLFARNAPNSFKEWVVKADAVIERVKK